MFRSAEWYLVGLLALIVAAMIVLPIFGSLTH
jgi:hypothetical protein